MNKIYTKFGDVGRTKLISGDVVYKNNPLIEACGSLDELNANLGLLRAKCEKLSLNNHLITIQEKLFTIAMIVSESSRNTTKKSISISQKDIEFLENEINIMDLELPELKNFIIPGNNELSAMCHITRTICRRTERTLVKAYLKHKNIPVINITFLNRLSDYLFMLSRKINFELEKKEDVKWMKNLY